MILDTPALHPDDYRVLEMIDGLQRKLRNHVSEQRRWVGHLRRLSLARNIRGSNSIEGLDVTLDDAFAAIEGEEPLDEKSEAWQAVSGYRDAMTYVLTLAKDEQWRYDENLIRGLHFMLCSYDLTKRPGLWRVGDVHFVREDDGQTVYTGPDMSSVPPLMQELSRHLNDRNSVPPMVNAAMAHLNLVMVHPFKDGNGRMARVLQSLVLAVAGVQTAPEFCSIEEYLGRNTGAYYDILEMVRQGSWHPANDALAWVRFNLVAHYRQAITVLRRARQAERLYVLAEREVGRARLLERMTDPMFHSLSGLRLNNSVYRDLAGVNDATASRDLKALVDARLLVPIGEKRGRSYVPVNRLVEVHAEVRATLPAELSADIDPYKEEGRAEQLVLA